MEVHLGFLFAVWAFVKLFHGTHSAKVRSVAWPYVLLIMGLVTGYAVGVLRGGDIVFGLWELRGLFSLVASVFLMSSVIDSEERVRKVVWIAIIAISIKAAQGALRFASLGFSFGVWPNLHETLTNHEDAVFVNTLVLFVVCFFLFKAKTKQLHTIIALAPVLSIGFVAANRRSAYAAMIIALFALFVMIPWERKKRFLKTAAPIALIFGLYLAVFWNSYSRVGFIALQIRSTLTGEAGIRGDKDVGSSFYREQENYNLALTYRQAPATGVGFGQPFLMAIRLWVPEGLGHYIPHNQILWVFVKGGVFAGFVFWFFFNNILFRGARTLTAIRSPYLQAVTVVGCVAVLNQFVVSYVDMQLTYPRSMVYLGTLISIVLVSEHLATMDKDAKSKIPGKGIAGEAV